MEKIKLIFIWFNILGSLVSCTTIKVNDSYYQAVSSGRKGVEKSIELTVQLSKKERDSIRIKKVEINGLEGMSYVFEDIVLMSKNQSNTLESSYGEQHVCILLNSKKAERKFVSVSKTPQAIITYLDGEKEKTLKINDITYKGQKNLR